MLRPEKIHQNSPPISVQNSQANSKSKSTQVFWRAGKVKFPQNLEDLKIKFVGGQKTILKQDETCKMKGLLDVQQSWWDMQSEPLVSKNLADTDLCRWTGIEQESEDAKNRLKDSLQEMVGPRPEKCPFSNPPPPKKNDTTVRKGRTWAIAVRRGSYKSLFLLNSGRFSLEK